MKNSHTINSLRNLLFGFGYRILFIGLNFVLRTIFIQILSAELLGIDGLYTNILQVLSLTELGLKNAMTFSLYEPLRNDNKEKIKELIAYFRRIYNFIAVIIAIIGLMIIPFLDFIVNTDSHIEHLELYYIIFLARTVFSYLFFYRVTLVVADQKEYLVRIYSTYTILIQFFLQIIVLLVFENYILYLSIFAIMQLLTNLFIAYQSSKLYPYLNEPHDDLSKKDRLVIVDNMKSLFIYSVGSVLLNKTDTIITSILVGTVWVGIYSNYMMIIEGIKSITQVIFQSVVASIGNLNVNIKNDEKKRNDSEKMYNVINFSAFWIYGICSICFYFLFNIFIELWIGKEYILSMSTVIPIIINFYMPGMLRSTSMYRDTTGLFSITKYVYLLTSIINLILSLILGRYFGLTGILYATVIARLMTNFWYEPFILHRKFFKAGIIKYFIKQLKFLSILIVSILMVQIVINLVSFQNILHEFIFRLSISIIIPNIIFLIFLYRTKEFQYIRLKLINLRGR